MVVPSNTSASSGAFAHRSDSTVSFPVHGDLATSVPDLSRPTSSMALTKHATMYLATALDVLSSSKVAKNGEGVFKARSGDTTYGSMLPGKESIRYSLRSAYHRELLPEGDGVSYWVLRVEVVKEDLKYNIQR
ncbi:hypothetical protein EDD11_001928 [Mortierella claussenii]|nr:hypothetical protein EDD11_001928 [Mortierella claussenii]